MLHRHSDTGAFVVNDVDDLISCQRKTRYHRHGCKEQTKQWIRAASTVSSPCMVGEDTCSYARLQNEGGAAAQMGPYVCPQDGKPIWTTGCAEHEKHES